MNNMKIKIKIIIIKKEDVTLNTTNFINDA